MPDQATNRTNTKDIKMKNQTGTKDIEPKTENQTQIQLDQAQIKLDPGKEPDAKLPIWPTESVEQRDQPAEGATATTPQDAEDDEEVYYHDSGDLSAENLEGNLAVLPEILILTTAKVSIEDPQVGDSGSATPEEIKRLRQIIWKKRHLLIGKGNALPPAAKGVVCDIDVGNAKPIAPRTRKVPTRFHEKVAGLGNALPPAAKGVVCDIDVGNAKPMALRTRKVPTRFHEKVAGLIKGLLAAEIFRPSTSPWASAIGIVRKSNGVDSEDLDKALCRMPFGLKNAPQIYQRLVYNALYGFLKVSRSGDAGATAAVFQTGIADDPDREVEDLLKACDKWDLWIGVAKSFWGMNKSFLGSLNYYSRFIEDYAIYASVLYELREVEFTELEKRPDLREIMDRNDTILRDHDPPEPQLTGTVDERTRDPGPNEAFYVDLGVQVDGITRSPGAMVCLPGPMDTRDHEVHKGRVQFSAIVWSLPGWEVVKVRSGYLESLTVTEAEYNGLILGLDMLESLDRRRLVVCGDSNVVIRQRKGVIMSWFTSRGTGTEAPTVYTLQRQGGIEVQEMPGYQDLVTLNRLDEILIPKTGNPEMRLAAVTTRAGRARSPAGVMQEDLIREIWVDWIKQAQEEEVWIAGMKKYLSGSIADLTQAEARSYGKIAADYEVDEQNLLFYCPPTPRSGDDRDRLMRLVVPETLQSDV
ncbi:reverse transcriptase [Phytophthora megakarya]|uniref:Reverse transcriptase n=1 Tax=Phytophthora megakarya TaxID=4795 RepID=A0A225VZ53_9STRA|nr:reverse transcriptase [Phytophthora megakarya]